VNTDFYSPVGGRAEKLAERKLYLKKVLGLWEYNVI
jgi:hypothetical protein